MEIGSSVSTSLHIDSYNNASLARHVEFWLEHEYLRSALSESKWEIVVQRSGMSSGSSVKNHVEVKSMPPRGNGAASSV